MEEVAASSTDFLDFLGPDTSATVFTMLHDPADLARASAVSRSWRTFVIANQFSKMQCLRVCPEVSTFARVEVRSSSGGKDHDVAGPSAHAEGERLSRDHMVYMHLAHGLLAPYSDARNCITRCIGASSTDNFPEETIENTLEPIDRVEMRPSYWSSGGQRDPAAPEWLIYRLQADLCLVDEVKVQPFKAFFQYGDPIYSAKCIRFKMGYPTSPLEPETLVCDENEGQLIDDSNYVWTYTSPEFPMLQENVLQSFKLPHPVLCIGGVVKVELLGRVQKQAMDGLYYICVSHVQIVGKPVSQELEVAPHGKCVVMNYYPDPRRCSVARSDSSGDDGRSKWHGFASRFWHSGRARGIGGLNQGLLSRLFGAPLQFGGEDDVSDEEGELL
ncbi:F-box protein At4g00755-like [Lolium rigidum]|uniref:F-box protein At4g00755-like n=1 Tax=Lolium rigidum TaxID=89674 RepID=UPI001F5C6705|nr:F-box protein At4g00755-like [Lolium rigidum]